MTRTVARVAAKIINEPKRAFEIEVIGRLVEQQKIGRGEQNRGERDAHPPAAGIFLERRFCAVSRSRAPQEFLPRALARSGRRNQRDASEYRRCVRIGRGLGLGDERNAFQIGEENEIDQRRVAPPGASCSTRPKSA